MLQAVHDTAAELAAVLMLVDVYVCKLCIVSICWLRGLGAARCREDRIAVGQAMRVLEVMM